MSAIPVPFVPCLSLWTGESAADRVCRFVQSFDGVSLDHRQDDLDCLVARGVDKGVVQAFRWATNCATSALGFIAAGCGTVNAAFGVHPLLSATSLIGTSPTWLFQIGKDTGMLTPYKHAPLIKGLLLSYANGDHFEWCLENEAEGVNPHTLHGGGGRARNAITIGRGDLRFSLGRPLTHVFDVPSILPASPDAASGELDRVMIGFTASNATAEGG